MSQPDALASQANRSIFFKFFMPQAFLKRTWKNCNFLQALKLVAFQKPSQQFCGIDDIRFLWFSISRSTYLAKPLDFKHFVLTRKECFRYFSQLLCGWILNAKVSLIFSRCIILFAYCYFTIQFTFCKIA